MSAPSNITILGVKFGSVVANLASIASFGFYIADRTSSLPTKSGLNGFNIVLHLTVLTAIGFGTLWTLSERSLGWNYGAGGGEKLPSGWSAVALSLCMTVPLAVIPFLYQVLTGAHVLFPAHWRAILLVLLLGIGAHLLIYGTASEQPNGIRHKISPLHEDIPFATGVLMEGIYSALFVGLLVLSYRLVVNPTEPMLEIVLGRTILSSLVFFSGMVVFIAMKYPGSLKDPTWIQVRGVVSGLLIMFSLCGGMFL